MVIVWLLVAVLFAVPFVTYTAFLVLSSVKRTMAAGVQFPNGMMVIAKFWLIIGWPCDVLFNATYGKLIYGEWRELTFSAHTQWRIDNNKATPKTLMWAAFLNQNMPGHVRRVPG